MAVSNPAKLTSICDELGLTGSNRTFLRAVNAPLNNPDFFTGKDKYSLKNWNGYENIAPTMKIRLVWNETGNGAENYWTHVYGTVIFRFKNESLARNLTFDLGGLMLQQDLAFWTDFDIPMAEAELFLKHIEIYDLALEDGYSGIVYNVQETMLMSNELGIGGDMYHMPNSALLINSDINFRSMPLVAIHSRNTIMSMNHTGGGGN